MKIKQRRCILPHAQQYTAGEITIIRATETGRLHISVSHGKRLPTWDEMKEIRDKLCPNDKIMAMIMPPSAEYVNIHRYCFHLWEIG